MAVEKKEKLKKSVSKSAPKPATPKVAAPKSDAQTLAVAGKRYRRTMSGIVTSDKMNKTIVVSVSRQYRHGFYKKYVTENTRYKAHDEKNEAKVGDRVTLVESRPLSRDKRWALKSIDVKAGQVPTSTMLEGQTT